MRKEQPRFDERVKQYVVHDAPAIRIDDVRVIDGTGAPAKAGQSILIRDGKIVGDRPRRADGERRPPTS